MTTKGDPTAATVTVDGRGLVRVDQIPIFALTRRSGELWIQVRDRNRMRSCIRDTDTVEVPLDALVAKLTKEDERRR